MMGCLGVVEVAVLTPWDVGHSSLEADPKDHPSVSCVITIW